jgi:GGDEF domain-containing protein
MNKVEIYTLLSIILALSILIISILIILIINRDNSKDKLIFSRKKIDGFKNVSADSSFVIFIEITNLNRYSQFYDISMGYKLLLSIYYDLQKIFDKKQIILYGSNQIVVIGALKNKDVKETKLRWEEVERISQDVIDCIAAKKYSLNNNLQYYTASLTVGASFTGVIFKETNIEELVRLANFTMLKAKEQGLNVLVSNEEIRILKKDLDAFNLEIEKSFELDEFVPFFCRFVSPQLWRAGLS